MLVSTPAFCIVKCPDASCQFHKQKRLDVEVKSLPDPILDQSGTHFQPFSEVYGTPTTEKHRPSLPESKQQGSTSASL